MGIELTAPVIYLITNGRATNQTLTSDCERLLALIESAVAAGVSLIQIREKNLNARALYELTRRAAQLTRKSPTKLLVNDRADIARSAGADGVHLTSRSLNTQVVRSIFGIDFLIGVSTHTLDEARAARDNGGDFAVFGPVFETPSKMEFSPMWGADTLRDVARDLSPFLIIALGGITQMNATAAFSAGAGGIAAIRAFSHPENLVAVVNSFRSAAVMH